MEQMSGYGGPSEELLCQTPLAGCLVEDATHLTLWDFGIQRALDGFRAFSTTPPHIMI